MEVQVLSRAPFNIGNMKQQIRDEILYKRAKLAETEKAPLDNAVTSYIEELPEFQNAKEVLIYIPIHGEVDATELFNKYKEEKKFVLPRIIPKEKKLSLFEIETLDDLEKGTYNIPEPLTHLPQVTPEELDLAIIPGVAYEKNGHRIGYGGGFYDRLIKKLSCPTIGVAYDFQIVKNIEGEDHDEKVDILVTESGAIKISTT